MINWKPRKTREILLVYFKSDAKVPYIEIDSTGELHSVDVLEQYVPRMEKILEYFKKQKVDEVIIDNGAHIENCVERFPVTGDISKKFKEMENQYNGIVEQKEVKKVEYNCIVRPIRAYAIDDYILVKK